VWFTNIPKLWRLRDADGDGTAEVRDAVHDGYGVHSSLIGQPVRPPLPAAGLPGSRIVAGADADLPPRLASEQIIQPAAHRDPDRGLRGEARPGA